MSQICFIYLWPFGQQAQWGCSSPQAPCFRPRLRRRTHRRTRRRRCCLRHILIVAKLLFCEIYNSVHLLVHLCSTGRWVGSCNSREWRSYWLLRRRYSPVLPRMEADRPIWVNGWIWRWSKFWKAGEPVFLRLLGERSRRRQIGKRLRSLRHQFSISKKCTVSIVCLLWK